MIHIERRRVPPVDVRPYAFACPVFPRRRPVRSLKCIPRPPTPKMSEIIFLENWLRPAGPRAGWHPIWVSVIADPPPRLIGVNGTYETALADDLPLSPHLLQTLAP